MKVLDSEDKEHDAYKIKLRFDRCDAYSSDYNCKYYHLITNLDVFCCEHPEAQGNKRGWLISCPLKMAEYCDYEVIEHCKWGVPDMRSPEGESDCGEPATHRVWWDDYENAIPVCSEHFRMIRNAEKLT